MKFFSKPRVLFKPAKSRRNPQKGELPEGMDLVNPVKISIEDIKNFIDEVIEKNSLSDNQVQMLEKVKKDLE